MSKDIILLTIESKQTKLRVAQRSEKYGLILRLWGVQDNCDSDGIEEKGFQSEASRLAA